MATQAYPTIFKENLEGVMRWINDVARIRRDDIGDYTNLPNIYMRGRKVGKIPTASNDVSASDKIGDFNYDANYMYLLVDNSGAAWRRITLGAW